ncbi:hypothetical protein CC78DRAFT_530534 [Lojkania enalia]|uniref:Developmental regulatory protein wetA n=1 Tax=Lojkania enalia TaxID=147567 RepID=A0A9P4KEJ2_9PLEO|nr:hypothetical protein CC78DRAFT_530534 [Didymosphaeria enalia]
MNSSTDPFHVQLPPSVLPSSPPPSSKFLQEENSGGFFARNQPYTIAMSPLEDEDASADIHHSNYQLTPLSSPTIDINSHAGTGNLFQFSNDKMATAYVSHHMSNAALSALQTPPDSHHLSMETWDPETPASLDFSFSASPEFQSPNPGKMQGWWGNTNTPATAPQPAVLAYQASASRSQSQAMGFSTASVAGLGITCDTASFPGLGAELERPSGNTQTTGFTPSASSFDMNCTSMYNNPIPISQSSPSRSPSLSPFLQPRFSRRRQSSNPSHTTRTHRRKSSTSSSHCTIRSSTVGFVNFTPDDSRKILTGVAPSGSSKTKARREKEAAEKRRKLSRAAVKAVMDVGGDIGGLEKEGLLCVE